MSLARTALPTTIAALALFGALNAGSANAVQTLAPHSEGGYVEAPTIGANPVTRKIPMRTLLWPAKPFAKPRPIRGTFGEPRNLAIPRNGLTGPDWHAYLYGLNQAGIHGKRGIHDGVDIVLRKGTVVYSLEDGKVRLGGRGQGRYVRVGNFRYEHVRPLVRANQRVKAFRTPIAVVNSNDHHLHLTRYHRGRAINPLRYGGFVGYKDTLAPRLGELNVYAEDGHWVSPDAVSGRVAFMVRADDPQSQAPFSLIARERAIKEKQLADQAAFGESHAGTGIYRLRYVVTDTEGNWLAAPTEVFRAEAVPNRASGDRLYAAAANKDDFNHNFFYRLNAKEQDGLIDVAGFGAGDHWLFVTAWDVDGNQSSEIYPFTVV